MVFLYVYMDNYVLLKSVNMLQSWQKYCLYRRKKSLLLNIVN